MQSPKTPNPLERLEAMGKTEAARRESERERNRREFPKLAGILDMVREFYPEARLVAGIEDGCEIGKVDDALRRSYARNNP